MRLRGSAPIRPCARARNVSRLLIEQAPEAVVVLDLEQNRLVEVNAQAERLFGCGREELLASNPQRFYTPEQPDAQPIAESMRAYSERALGGETVAFERTICTARGQRLHCEVRLVRRRPGSASRFAPATLTSPRSNSRRRPFAKPRRH